MTYPSGRVVSYDYDNADRVTHVAQSGQVWATSFGYHATGAIAAYTSGNGQTTAITYDNRQRPDQLTSGPLSLNYDYDQVGNVQAIDDGRPAFSQSFDYDNLDRLTAVTGFGAATFGYDARGNRRSRNGVTYSYDGGTDRLTSDGAQSFGYDGVGNATAIGAQTYTYTPFGQLQTATVAGAQTEYWYDADQQRRMRRLSTGVQEYFVPGPGLVPLAEYRKASGGSRVLVREYIYAGDRLIASEGFEPTIAFTGDDPVVAGVTAPDKAHVNELRTEVNALRQRYGLPAYAFGTAVATGDTVTAARLLALRTALDDIAPHTWPSEVANPAQPLAIDHPIRAAHLNELRARLRALHAVAYARVFYHLDALGSVRAVTDQTGATVRRHDYAAFGEEPTPIAGADARRFTGKERDAETGLDYFSARYYLSTTGRFATVDPLMDMEKNVLDPQQWNRYTYARANPLKYIDRNGEALETLWDIFNVGLGISSLVKNVREGNIGSALLDAGGIVVDGAAAAVPILPGGAGAALRAARAGEALGDKITGISLKVGNLVENNLNSRTLDAARRELAGEVVKINPATGRAYDHIRKAREAIQGLRNQIDDIHGLLRRGGLTKKARFALEQDLRRAQDKLKEAESYGIG